MIYPLTFLALLALLTGCSSLPGGKRIPGPSAIEVYQARREPPPPIEPALSAMPRSPINPTQPATVAQTPLPVWNDAQVVRVDLDAYVNEKGEAFGPSVKYVVKQPGGWNVDALRNPHRSYVPTENMPPVPSANGFTTNPLVAPGDSARTIGDIRPLQPSVLQDLNNVRLTGFIERSQENYARSVAQPGEVPLFDESLGWVLVPSSALVPSNQIPASVNAPQPATPIQMAPAVQSMQQAQQFQQVQQIMPQQQMMAPQASSPVPAAPVAQPPTYGTPAFLPRQ